MRQGKTTVEILHRCGDFEPGQTLTLDAMHAYKLVRSGNARDVHAPEDAAATAPERATVVVPPRPGRRPERRG